MEAEPIASVLPQYRPEQLALLDVEALIERLLADEDRTPRELVDECARRGEAMVERLAVLVQDERYWDESSTPGEWWLRLHAVMILGLIPGDRAAALLVSFMRRMHEAHDTDLQDWLSGHWPALFWNKPEGSVPLLRALAQDRSIDWYTRTQAVECLMAAAQRQGAAALEAELDWVARLAADESEDWTLRLASACGLLDFPRERHRAFIEKLAERQSQAEQYYGVEDIERAYAIGKDEPQWDSLGDPWKFYQPQAIAERQARWAQEDAESEDDDLSDDMALPFVRVAAKVGRNDPCPCGSGKKYKKCCLLDED